MKQIKKKKENKQTNKTKNLYIQGYQNAPSEDSDQTARMSVGTFSDICDSYHVYEATSEEFYTVNPHYTDTLYNDRTRYKSNLTGTKLSLKRCQLIRNYARIFILFNTSRSIYFEYMLESPQALKK